MCALLADFVCLFDGLADILFGFERWETAWFDALPKCALAGSPELSFRLRLALRWRFWKFPRSIALLGSYRYH